MALAITPDRNGSRLTVAEIAADLDLHPETVRGLLRDRTIPSIRMGRSWLVTRQAYKAWKESAGRRERLAS